MICERVLPLKKIISLFLVLAAVITVFSGFSVSAATVSSKCSISGTYWITYDTTTVFNVQSSAKPTVDAHNGKIVRVRFLRSSGNTYYYSISAVGGVGSSTGVYASENGKNQKLLFVAKVGAISIKSDMVSKHVYLKVGQQSWFLVEAPVQPVVAPGNTKVATTQVWNSSAKSPYTYTIYPKHVGSTNIYASIKNEKVTLFTVTVTA